MSGYKHFFSIWDSLLIEPGLEASYDDVILPLQPESFSFLLSCAGLGFCYLNLTGHVITKFKYERTNKMNSGLGS